MVRASTPACVWTRPEGQAAAQARPLSASGRVARMPTGCVAARVLSRTRSARRAARPVRVRQSPRPAVPMPEACARGRAPRAPRVRICRPLPPPPAAASLAWVGRVAETSSLCRPCAGRGSSASRVTPTSLASACRRPVSPSLRPGARRRRTAASPAPSSSGPPAPYVSRGNAPGRHDAHEVAALKSAERRVPPTQPVSRASQQPVPT
jgi:hypothetical protein